MDFDLARRNMVENQIRIGKVTDARLIRAMRTVPREAFVPAALQGVAYIDDDMPLGGGRMLLAPAVLAGLMQLLEIREGDTVLDVGCGSGYSSAVLAKMALSVVALEPDPVLAKRASEILASLAVDNAAVMEGELSRGLPRQGPYDVILVGGRIPRIPDGLKAQLNDGGRLAALIDDRGIGRAMLVERRGEAFAARVAFDAAGGFLPGFAAAAGFAL